MDRAIGSTENARTAREVVLVDPATGAPASVGGTGAAAGQVQGPAADNAAAAGNPVPVGLRYKATLDTYADGDIGYGTMNSRGALLVCTDQFFVGDGQSATPVALMDRGGAGRVLATAGYVFNGTTYDRIKGDATGGVWTQGPAADNAASVGNPVWGAAKYFSGVQTYANGDVASLQANASGHLLVGAEAVIMGDSQSTTVTAMTDRGGAGRPLAIATFEYNGSGWDRRRKPVGSHRLLSSAATTNAGVAKAASGDLRKVIGRNVSASVIYLKIFNKAAAPAVGTDTPLLTIPLAPTANFDLDFEGQYFGTGIAYAFTSGVGDADTGSIAAGDVLGLNITFA